MVMKIKSECYICRKFGPDMIKSCSHPFLDLLDQILEHCPQLREKKKDLLLILSELYRNALEHGVLELAAVLNNDLNTIEKYFIGKKRAIENLRSGWIKICLNFNQFFKKGNIIIRIEDSGDGFDYRSENAFEPDSRTPNGRGIILVKSLCNKLEFFENGNTVQAVYCFDL
jgi:anti-sigma regulatory factor (Ser/Thr protein kinase)